MKKIFIALIVPLIASSVIFAQASTQTQNQGTLKTQTITTTVQTPQNVTLDGTLAYDGDTPLLVTKDAKFTIVMHDFYRIAYQNGLKAGSALKITGFLPGQVNGPENSFLCVTRLVVGSKTFEFPMPYGRGGFMMGGFGPMDGYGPMGGYGRMDGYGPMYGQGYNGQYGGRMRGGPGIAPGYMRGGILTPPFAPPTDDTTR